MSVPFGRMNALDKMIAYFNPAAAAERLKARTLINMVGQYTGARGDRTSFKHWHTHPGSADSDSLGDLETLRARSRDLVRNEPIATGAIATATTGAVGTGLRVKARIDREILGLSDDEADKWERLAERIFRAWSESPACDITLTGNFAALQRLAFRSTLENGDVFTVRRYVERPGSILGLAIQLIEADRVSNPDAEPETDAFRGGVELDANGAPVRYHIRNSHPGESLWSTTASWVALPAFGPKTGERLVLHLYDRLRVGQTRGIPYLAPVIEALKQLGRYSEAELMAAVVSAMFTVFVKSKTGEGLGDMEAEGDAPTGRGEYALGSGAILDLGPDEEIEIANPGRPNANFDPFFIAIVRQIGVALEIPFELLVKHFTASYSASRAAIEMAWQFFKARRKWLIDSFCQPVYEWALTEMVARGLLPAPGFFDNPLIRRAWLGAEWMGDVRLTLDPLKESKADEVDIKNLTRTRAEIMAEKTGRDWEREFPDFAKEARMIREAGIPTGANAAAVDEPNPPE